MLEIYFYEYYDLSDAERKKIEPKYDPDKLFLMIISYDYDGRFTEEELDDEEESVDLSDMTPLEGDEEVKVEVTPNKLLAGLPIILPQMKAGNNSYKLKNKIRQMLYLLYQYKKSPKKVYKKLIKSL